VTFSKTSGQSLNAWIIAIFSPLYVFFTLFRFLLLVFAKFTFALHSRFFAIDYLLSRFLTSHRQEFQWSSFGRTQRPGKMLQCPTDWDYLQTLLSKFPLKLPLLSIFQKELQSHLTLDLLKGFQECHLMTCFACQKTSLNSSHLNASQTWQCCFTKSFVLKCRSTCLQA